MECPPGFSLLKPEGEPVELGLANSSLLLFGLVSSHHNFKNIWLGLVQKINFTSSGPLAKCRGFLKSFFLLRAGLLSFLTV